MTTHRQSNSDRLDVPASVYERDWAWCSNCGRRFDLSHIYKIGRLYLCDDCWRLIVSTFAECFPDLASVSSEIYRE